MYRTTLSGLPSVAHRKFWFESRVCCAQQLSLHCELEFSHAGSVLSVRKARVKALIERNSRRAACGIVGRAP